jgi:hypothetical protein
MAAAVGLAAGGCAEHQQTAQVPAYQPAPVYQAPLGGPPQTVYVYPQQSTYQSQPLVTQVPPGADPNAVPQSPQVQNAPQAPVAPQVQTAPPPGQQVVSQAPPQAQVEVIPAAPGPGYAWTPGYWAWNGGWVWVGGGWVLRPHPYSVWVGPHWVHRSHGYVYVRGYWR